MTDSEPNFSDEVAKKSFIITVVCTALFVGAVFIFIL